MENHELKQLKQIVEHVNAQPEQKDFYSKYPLGVTWVRNVFKVLNEIIQEESSAEEKLQSVQDTDLFNSDSQDDIVKGKTLQCWTAYFLRKGIDLRSLDPSFQESPYYQEKNTFNAFGKLFSLDFFTKLNIVFDIEKYRITPRTVLEIGGGFGAQARLLKLRYPFVHQILIDLPETLFFAYINLKLNFPSAKIIFTKNKDEVEKYVVSQDYDFLLVPSFFSDYLSRTPSKIDLAINTRSFGEMHNKGSKYYIDLIENKLNVTYILLLNRFLNTVDSASHPQRLQENGCYAQLGPNWKVIHWETDPEFTNFPFFEQASPRELYFMAEKCSTPEGPDIEDIFLHSWYREFNTHPNYHSKYKYSNDVLSRLVNSVRVNPHAKNLDALIKYMYTLEGKFPFEERYYYMDLYKKMIGKAHPLAQKQYHRFLTNALMGESRFMSETRLLYIEKLLFKIHLLHTARKFRRWIIKRIEKNG